MTRGAARFLTQLYPPAWRARFGAEFQTFLELRPVSAREVVSISGRAAAERLEIDVPRRRLILVFGLLIGAIWTASFLFGNLGDTALLGNFRTAHLRSYRIVGWSFVDTAVALTALAGFLAAQRLGAMGEALRVTVWSGFFSGMIAAAALMAIEIVFHNALSQSPSVLREFAQGGQGPCVFRPASSCLSEFMYIEALGGSANMLWFGPLLGITAGLLGASGGMLARRGFKAAS